MNTKKIEKIFIFVCFVIIGLTALQKISAENNLDVWYLLKTGEYMWQTKSFMWQDVFSWSVMGHVNSTHEWGSSLIFYLIYLGGGLGGLVLLKSILTLLFAYIVYKTFQLFEIPAIVSGLIMIIIIPMIVNYAFTIRPQLFTFVFLAYLFYLLERFYLFQQTKKITKATITKLLREYFWSLPLVFVMWANLHAGVLAGIGLIGIYLGCEILKLISLKIKKRREKEHESILLNIKVLIIILGVAVICSLLNPSTYQVFTYYFDIQPELARQYILEWQPLFGNILSSEVLLFVKGSILILTIIYFIYSEDRDLSIIFVFLLLAVSSIRHLPLLAICILVFGGKYLAQNLRLLIDSIAGYRRMIPISCGFLIIIGIINFSLIDFGLGVNSQGFPEEVSQFILQQQITGKMYNDYNDGGYLIWKLYPANQVFLDGRFDLYIDNDVFLDYKSMYQDNESIQRVLKNYNFDFLIIPNGNKKEVLAQLIFHNYNDDWALVFADTNSFLFLNRTKPEYQDLIPKFEIKAFKF